jgi:hypothetical protein
MVIKNITFYYDGYEKRFGDGFYPLTKPVNGYETISISFKFIDGCWQQISGDPINGFDGNERRKVLVLLNDNEYKSFIILDLLGYVI